MRVRLFLSSSLLALSLGATALSWEGRAFAQSGADTTTARDLGIEGQKAFEAGDFKTAEEKFRKADDIMKNKVPTLGIGYARAAAKNGHWVAAQEAYNRIILAGEPSTGNAPFHKSWEDAQKEVGDVAPHIAGIIIKVTNAPADVAVTIDGQPVPTAALGEKRAVDPGSHKISVTAAGYKPVEVTKETAEGQPPPTVEVTLEKDPNAGAGDPSKTAGTNEPIRAEASTKGASQKTYAYIAFGVGGAGLLVGAITGAIALGKHSDLKEACSTGTCPADQKSQLDSYHTMGTLSTVGFIVGAVGVGAGAVLFLTAPKETKPPETTGWIRPYIGFGTAGATGRF